MPRGTEEEVSEVRGWKGQPAQPEIFRPGIRFEECPGRASMGVLGKKWTLLILRDIGFRRIDRFNDLMRSNPGLGPRILSRRLKELESKGFIRCLESTGSPMVVRWGLTKKGKDALPILAQFLIFGARWYADEVFIDKKPREPDELFIPGALALIRSERR